jgi:hypothetical protein
MTVFLPYVGDVLLPSPRPAPPSREGVARRLRQEA